jgi:hypothetical protein
MLLANERKLTVCPSPLIEGATLLPFKDGDKVPAGWLATAVEGVQLAVCVMHVLRANTFSIPFAVFAPRFDAAEAKARNWPVLLNEGFSASEFAGVVPSRVEPSSVVGVQPEAPRHVSRM